MNLKNQPPLFVPREYRAEIEKLSKAALMDIAWDFAQRCAAQDPAWNENAALRQIMEEFRRTADIITTHRRHQ